jgi:hypothetical protein
MILYAGLLVLLYPLFLLGVFMASFMAAAAGHYWLAFIYWGLTALFTPWFRNPAYKSALGWVLGLQGCALFVTGLVAALAK